MKSDFVQLTFALVVLLVGAAAEELLPAVSGVGFPVLLAALPFAARRSVPLMLVLAVLFGAMEDALAALPFATSIGYFVLVAFLARGLSSAASTAALAYPAYQLWLWLWVPGLGGSVFVRTALAFPMGALTVFAADFAIARMERGFAIDE